MDTRGQFSFDLMIVLGIMLLLFLSLFQFYIGKSEDVSITRQKISGKILADSLASRLDGVLLAGNGTLDGFDLPQSLADGENYSIAFVGRRVDVVFRKGTASSPIPTSDIISSDLNLKKGSRIAISNVGGRIYLE